MDDSTDLTDKVDRLEMSVGSKASDSQTARAQQPTGPQLQDNMIATEPRIEQTPSQSMPISDPSDEPEAMSLVTSAQAQHQATRDVPTLANVSAPAESAPGQVGQPVIRHESQDMRWTCKDILFPPQAGAIQRPIKIVTQNRNGPCSLIALANVLILRGDLVLAPPNRETISYATLSSLVADYLLRLSDRGDGQTKGLDLTSALSLLPKMRYGLDVNIRFDAIDGFETSTTTGEVELFKLAGVPLVHGMLADQDDEETYDLLMSKAPDYDTAQGLVAEGDAIARGMVVGANEASDEQIEAAVDARQKWTDEQEALVRQAMHIRHFLEGAKTQLTYPGLFALSSTLTPGSISTLFYNSHLSVLYRRPNDLAQTTDSALYLLVTDSSFASEPNVVWETLGDLDGTASSFFNSDLQASKIRDDYVQGTQRHGTRAEAYTVNNDEALAASLQQEEYDIQHRHQRREDAQAQQASAATPSQIQSADTAVRPPKVSRAKVKKDCVIQ
ncbi:uncharacterized protein L969DRAFT_88902 [Mixia osmundae IAM 14324]|uniref:uncharacterized protein n=1 Tax=Mixia osmundae (strain CBS 9802 / IAM 14324 / JCM 22182 / KY 12970) TaxID=764103 RepID=UPI0004A54F79|nr:uncharacterized protein L969DRAFT_88902 [Mixia osmundae IAM 14324]KEI38464.1 hypothetical protein L969DRAFT_88902 [Mixia osmundae IAM 14324]